MEPLKDGLLELVRKKIREHMNEQTDHMAGGGCSSYDDYRHSVGIILGLAMAEREILDLNDRIEE